MIKVHHIRSVVFERFPNFNMDLFLFESVGFSKDIV
jgi:hypothetical protein